MNMGDGKVEKHWQSGWESGYNVWWKCWLGGPNGKRSDCEVKVVHMEMNKLVSIFGLLTCDDLMLEATGKKIIHVPI